MDEKKYVKLQVKGCPRPRSLNDGDLTKEPRNNAGELQTIMYLCVPFLNRLPNGRPNALLNYDKF